MEVNIMMRINLKDFYPWYTHDEYVEVPDEIAEEMLICKRHEESSERRIRRYKAQYSLDADDGIEMRVAFAAKSPHEVLEFKEMFCNLCRALNALPEIQSRRIEAHYIIGVSIRELARMEGIGERNLRKSIRYGLRAMGKFLKKF